MPLWCRTQDVRYAGIADTRSSSPQRPLWAVVGVFVFVPGGTEEALCTGDVFQWCSSLQFGDHCLKGTMAIGSGGNLIKTWLRSQLGKIWNLKESEMPAFFPPDQEFPGKICQLFFSSMGIAWLTMEITVHIVFILFLNNFFLRDCSKDCWGIHAQRALNTWNGLPKDKILLL